MTQSSRHGSVLLLAIVLALAGSKGEAPVGAQGRGKLTGIVTHVADGDTLDITANGQTYTIRLDGIDAPERGQAFGQQARQHLRVLAFSQPATALVQDRDRYGRTVARVIVGGRDLSEEMVEAGLAWHFVRYSSDRRLAALEQQARQQRRGLWADRSALPPWQYRSDRSAASQLPLKPRSPAARSAALCWPIPWQRVEPRVSRGRMPGLQLPQLHAGVFQSPGRGGRGLSSPQHVRHRASVAGYQGRADTQRSWVNEPQVRASGRPPAAWSDETTRPASLDRVQDRFFNRLRSLGRAWRRAVSRKRQSSVMTMCDATSRKNGTDQAEGASGWATNGATSWRAWSMSSE